MTTGQFDAVVAVVEELVQAGVAVEGAVATGIKDIIGFFKGPDPTPAEIAADFAAVLASDEVLAATAHAQAGDPPVNEAAATAEAAQETAAGVDPPAAPAGPPPPAPGATDPPTEV